MRLIENKELGIRYELPTLTQGHIEDYFDALDELNKGLKDSLTLSQVMKKSGNVVRAAMKAKILPQAEVRAIDPKVVVLLAMEIKAHVTESVSVPKVLSSLPPPLPKAETPQES